ncbi:hypothetical protein RJ639_042018 [Escallonia herrerae]|uniref:Chaperone DnaJ-domain superfamily protein n=1 Tax=Escallonia herrerae TaxID=1293975 RepID=A0AA89B4M5_9ASTE|nr:hypothetical protein RJ639_042018 [Escallonia herrerae]
MSTLRAICRPNAILSSIACCCSKARSRSIVSVSIRNPNKPRLCNPSVLSSCFDSSEIPKTEPPWARLGQQRRTMVRAANWTDSRSPYETLVYDGRGTLEEGETAEVRFIKIQAAYELLMVEEKRRQYDKDNLVNPMKASQAWMEWLIKKRKAFDQRGDMAISAWAEQQQREMNLRVRRLSRSKMDPDEERRILAKEKKASLENFNNIMRRHTLVLRKRDIMRKKAEEEKKKIISRLLAAEGLELATDEDEAP